MKSKHSHAERGSLPGDRGSHPDSKQPEARAEVRVVREPAQGLGNTHGHTWSHVPEIEVINTVAHVTLCDKNIPLRFYLIFHL